MSVQKRVQRFGSDVTLETRIPGLQTQLLQKLSLVVERTALLVQRGAMIRSRVDTGQMRAGWRTRRVAPFEQLVLNGVQHVIFNEFGTRTLAPQPMLIPSIEAAEAQFLAGIRDAFRV